LGAEPFEAAWRSGQALPLQLVVEGALSMNVDSERECK